MKKILALTFVVAMVFSSFPAFAALWKPVGGIISNDPETANATISEKNALRVGEDYLDAMGFSYEGLVDQLMYEGFTYDEAVFACDILFERNALPVKKGSKGEKVKEVQLRLIELGFLNGGADGDFGSGTEKAVIAFQADRGIEATGIVDEETYDAMYSNQEENKFSFLDEMTLDEMLELNEELESRIAQKN